MNKIGQFAHSSSTIERGSWSDGVQWHAKRWTTPRDQPPVALLVALHGFAEHSGRYEHVWPTFAARGIEVFAYDQRGAGRSGPSQGDTTVRQNVEDLKEFILQERRRLDDRGLTRLPIWLYGHSMVRWPLPHLYTPAEGL